MTNYFLVYDDCCFYEIVLLGYFMRYSAMGEQPCAYCAAGSGNDAGDAVIRTAEGFCVRPDIYLNDINPKDVKSIIIPGGDTSHIMNEEVNAFLHSLDLEKTCIAAICAGVSLLEEYGFLKEKNTIRTSDALAVSDGLLVTARPNGYADFALEVGKVLGLFADEEDFMETLEFFKNHKSME